MNCAVLSLIMKSARQGQATQVVGDSTRNLGRTKSEIGGPASNPEPPKRKTPPKLQKESVHSVSLTRRSRMPLEIRCNDCDWSVPATQELSQALKAAEAHGRISQLHLQPKERLSALKQIRNIRKRKSV